jgi:hypothetical protein
MHSIAVRTLRKNVYLLSVGFLGNVFQLRNVPGTLRKNVTLIQKSSKTSVEQSFFAGCPRAFPRLHGMLQDGAGGAIWRGEIPCSLMT